jgi:RecJ-like exonuclease
MRRLILAIGFTFAAVSARAETLAPAEAQAHVGQTVTIEGAVSGVHQLTSGMTFIDLGDAYPANPFTAVILAADAGKFPNVDTLEGKTVHITGKVQLYKGKPEIVVNDKAQLTAK